MIRHPGTLAALGLSLALAWAPLPFGSVRPGAAAALHAAAFVALAVALVGVRRPARLKSALPALGLVGLALLGWVQVVAWPASLAAALAPEHVRLHQEAAWALEAATGDPAEIRAVPLSLAPDRSRAVAFHLLALAAAFAAAAWTGLHRRCRRLLLAAVVGGASFQVLYGARRWLVRATTIWGEEVPAVGGGIRGTFVNPNHLATFLLIALAPLFAWGFWAIRKAAREPSYERRLLMVAPPAVLWLTVFVGLALTRSRAALVAAALATGVQAVLASGGRHRRAVTVGLLVLLLGVGGVAVTGFEEGLSWMTKREELGLDWGSRVRVYGATVDLWLRFPLTGVGLGAFQDAFHLVRPEAVRGVWHHGHNDYLELLATGGLIGVSILGAGLLWLVRRLWKVLERGRRSEDRVAALAALGVLVAVGVQEAFDFGLVLPANAFAATVLVGAASGAMLRPRREEDGPHRAAPPRRPTNGPPGDGGRRPGADRLQAGGR